MTDSPVPAELEKFIARYVHSVEQLEILCLFVKDPGKWWPESEVFRHIQSSEQSVSHNLHHFADAGFLIHKPGAGYQFSAQTTKLARLAVDLVKTYRERRVTVIETIYKMPLDPMRHFAEAFRLRKEET